MNQNTFTKDQFTVNADGSITIAAIPIPSLADMTSAWISARAGETSTKLGVVGGAVAAPTIIDNVGQAVIAGLAGDYIGCAQHGIPALIGIVGAIAAIVTPDKPQPQPTGPTNDQLKTAISTLSRDELIGLLSESATTQSAVSTTNQPVTANQLQPSTAVVQPSTATGDVTTAVS